MLHDQQRSSSIGTQACAPRGCPARGGMTVVAGLVGVAARADQKAALEIHDLEDGHPVALVVLVAAAPLEQRIAVELARVQEGHVARVDAAFHRLQVIALLEAFGNKAALGRYHRPLELGRRGFQPGRSHVDPDHFAALDRGIGLQLDALSHAGFFRLRRQVHALAVHVVLPAVVGAAQAALLVAPEPQRHAAVRAEFLDDADAPFAVAEGDELLAHDVHPHGGAIALGDLPAVQSGNPVAAEQVAHQGAGSGARQLLVLLLGQHKSVP